MRYGRRLRLLLYACMWLAGPAFSFAAPPHVQQELGPVRLLGEGTYRWLGLPIYDASLWVRDGVDRPERMSAPFALDLRYARAFDGREIAESSAEQMQRLGLGSPVQRSQWFERMQHLFPNVAAGMRLTGIYLPGRGVRFYCNGKWLGDVADAEFGRAFFAIWLDEKTSAPSLRAALLGQEPR